PVDRLREVTLAGDVFDEQHLARTDHPLFPVARRDLDPAVEIDDVLPARRRMPVEVVVAAGLTKDDPRRRHASRQLAAGTLLDPLDLDVAEMRLALFVDVEIMDAHAQFRAQCDREFHELMTTSASSAVAPCPSACTISGLTSISISAG